MELSALIKKIEQQFGSNRDFKMEVEYDNGELNVRKFVAYNQDLAVFLVSEYQLTFAHVRLYKKEKDLYIIRFP